MGLIFGKDTSFKYEIAFLDEREFSFSQCGFSLSQYCHFIPTHMKFEYPSKVEPQRPDKVRTSCMSVPCRLCDITKKPDEADARCVDYVLPNKRIASTPTAFTIDCPSLSIWPHSLVAQCS